MDLLMQYLFFSIIVINIIYVFWKDELIYFCTDFEHDPYHLHATYLFDMIQLLSIIYINVMVNRMEKDNIKIQEIQKTNYQNIVHDIKTPILCMQSIIDSNYDEHKLLRTMLHIVSSRLSTINSKNIIPNFITTDLTDYVGLIHDIYKHLFLFIGLDFVVDNNLQIEFAIIDRDWILRCVENCLSNSIKYTKRGYVKLKFYNDDDYIYIEVEDSGKGISKLEKDRVFDKGYQVQAFGEGLGIGLHTIFTYIKAIKGNVYIRNISPGTNIKLQIPILKLKENNVTKMKLLIVEDDPFQRKIWKELLKCVDHMFANDGQEAIDILGSEEFDVIVTDLNMPYIDGEELLKHIKHMACRKVVCTANYDETIAKYLITSYSVDIVWDKANGFCDLLSQISQFI